MSSLCAVGLHNFQNEVLDSALPVLVDFWADWCGPCRMFAPVVESVAQAYAEKLKVVQVNIDEEPELASKYEVMTIPTVVLIRSGKTVDTVVGALPKHMLERWINQHV